MGTDTTAVSAKDAVRLAEQYVAGTVETMNSFRSMPAFGRTIDELRWGFTRDGAEGKQRNLMLLAELEAVTSAELATLFGVTVLTAETAQMWRRHRVVYRVHQGLADSLLDTDTKTVVPCEVFTRLPHPDPFIVFPHPFPAPVSVDAPETAIIDPPMCVGMLVTAMNEHEQVCSTADTQAHKLHISLASRLRYEGQDPTWEESTQHIPLSGRHSVEDLIEAETDFEHLGQLARDDMRSLYNLSLSLLLYLCSDHRDARDHQPEPGRRRGKKARRGEDKTIVDLGFDIGPRLHAARHTPSTDGAGIGAGVRPHLRRAHWHTYWTGPRETPTPEIRWLHPILVNKDDHQSRALVVDISGPE